MTLTCLHLRLRWGAIAPLVALAASACAGASVGPQSVRFTETPAVPTLTAEATSAPAPSPTPGCTESVGRVEALTYPGVVVRESIPLLVYLPPCYDAGQQRLPVAYLLHGKPYDESHWADLGVTAAADDGIASGRWPPFVLVLPLQPEPIFSNTDGGRWSYEEEMVEGLVPFIDQSFRTEMRPEGRAIAGISRGGVWALEIGLCNPDTFGALAALSPALAVNNPRPAYDPFQIVDEGQALPPHIFLAAGETDWARSATEAFSRALTQSGWDHALVLVPGGHDDATWQALLSPLLTFLSEAWGPSATPERTPATSVP